MGNDNFPADNNNNIIVNHDFSNGLQYWNPICCSSGLVISTEEPSGGNYAVVTNRTQWWQGLEQDITARVSPHSSYSVSACVGVSGPLLGYTHVKATLRLENPYSQPSYVFVGRTFVSKDRWEILQGTFSLSTNIPQRLVFYLEGPSAGLTLLVRSFFITCCSNISTLSLPLDTSTLTLDIDNIVVNPDFEDGLNNWSGRFCNVVLHDNMADGKIIPQSGTVFACATMRQESWSGIQQEISARVEAKVVYNVQGLVRIYGNHVKSATVQATLWFQTPDGQDHYIVIALIKCDRINCFDFSEWRSVIVYVEGPPPGTDILLNGLLIVKEAEKLNSPSTRVVPVIEECEGGNLGERENWEKPSEQENVINDVEGEGEMKGAAAIPFPGVSNQLETRECDWEFI